MATANPEVRPTTAPFAYCLLGWMVSAGLALILADALPPEAFDSDSGRFLLLLGFIASWRYSWQGIHLCRSAYYRHVTFPKLRREAEALAERIRTSVASHNFILSDGQIVRTTCSVGFVTYPLFRAQAEEANLDQVISLADGLMYEAKKQRNAWVGLLGPSEATTSFECDPATIESTSLLFRARRAGRLHTFSSQLDEADYAASIGDAS